MTLTGKAIPCYDLLISCFWKKKFWQLNKILELRPGMWSLLSDKKNDYFLNLSLRSGLHQNLFFLIFLLRFFQYFSFFRYPVFLVFNFWYFKLHFYTGFWKRDLIFGEFCCDNVFFVWDVKFQLWDFYHSREWNASSSSYIKGVLLVS